MLYHLFEYLEEQGIAGAGLFQYISFRSGVAIILSLIICMVFGSKIISSLKKLQIGETVRDLGLAGQKEKEGTPTMGGLLIIIAIIVPVLLLADLSNIYIQLMIMTTLWLGTIGFIDDYIKVFKKDKKGLHGRFKIIGQVGLGLIVGIVMLLNHDIVVRVPVTIAQSQNWEIISIIDQSDSQVDRNKSNNKIAYAKASITNLPFIKNNELDYSMIVGGNKLLLGIFYVLLIVFIVTGVSNGANLTDGLDGLLTGIAAIIGAALGILAYVSSNVIIADYLNILYLPYTEELVVFASCFLGSCVGFLWYNSHPASIFMGDSGSLMIGGVVSVFAILIRKELLIPILCGVILMETLSVMVQVTFFKYTRKKYGEGRRIFLMSPLHHHYQKKGIHETKIVVRFWIVSILLAVFAVITLKLR